MTTGGGGAAAGAPVGIETAGNRVPGERDLLINLCVEPVADVNRFRRLLEIVPAEPAQRDASREKSVAKTAKNTNALRSRSTARQEAT